MFKTFYKRDEVYKHFFNVGVTWNYGELNYGFTDDDNE